MISLSACATTGVPPIMFLVEVDVDKLCDGIDDYALNGDYIWEARFQHDSFRTTAQFATDFTIAVTKVIGMPRGLIGNPVHPVFT